MNMFAPFGSINQIPIVKPMVKRRIYNINGFYVSIADHIYNKEATELIFKSTCTDVLNRYLQNINTYKVQDHEIWREKFDIISYDFENTKLLRRFKRKYPDANCTFRLESDKYIFWIEMRKYEDTPTVFDGTLLFSDKDRKFAAIGTVSIDTKSYDYYDQEKIMITSAFHNKYLFITSFKDRLASNIAWSNSDTMEIEQGFTLAINTGLHKIIDGDFNPDRFGGEAPVHNEYEMMVFRKIIRMFDIQNLVCPLSEYINSDITRSDDIHISWSDIPEYFGMGNSFKNFPLIQLNEKEMRFISSYANKNAYKDNEVDLSKYLDHPRYGNILRMDINKNGLSGNIIISFEINNDDIAFNISQHTSDKFTYAIFVYFSGIKSFNIKKCHVANAHFLHMPKNSDIPSNLKCLNDTVLSMYTNEDIFDLITRFIEISIAIHDRPERTKMVKCLSKEYYIKKERNFNVDEKDYIISRILKTKSDAKEYVERMSGSRAECEYSVEEWDRIGHYRTLKSGKIVWVRETTCKRHLPLSEKEIRIKL